MCFKRRNRSCQIRLAIKNYYGIKLSTARATIIEKNEIDVELDWRDSDVKKYLNYENQTVNSSMNVLKNAKIKTVSLNIFKGCSNGQCTNKVKFTACEEYLLIVLCAVSRC